MLFDFCNVHFQIVVLCELHAGELVLCIEQEQGAFGHSAHFYCIPHCMQGPEIFDLVAEMGRGGGEDDVLGEVFTLIIVNNFCLPCLNLVFHSWGHSIHKNGNSNDKCI